MSYNKTMREIPKDKILAYAAFYDLEKSDDLELEKYILKKAQKIDGAKDLFKFLLDKENGILKWKGALRIERYFGKKYWDSVRKESFLNEIKKSCDDWNVNKEIVKRLAENKDYPGISYPIASTLVYFFSKGNCPIIDWRTVKTLTGDRLFNIRDKDWDRYFNKCLEIVNNSGISIRDLDKALWIYQDIKECLPICKCLSDLNIHSSNLEFK